MPLTGTLRSWNDDRGFGFIAPAGGGRELFVHISAFPRDGSRPTVGESLTYEPGRGKDGRPQAVRVYRQALGHPSTYPRTRAPRARHRGRPVGAPVGIALAIALAAYGYATYQRRAHSARLSAPAPAEARPVLASPQVEYRCDGRTRCAQMTSCGEAMFFLKNCPATEMDGDHDGVPCERQWCMNAR